MRYGQRELLSHELRLYSSLYSSASARSRRLTPSKTAKKSMAEGEYCSRRGGWVRARGSIPRVE